LPEISDSSARTGIDRRTVLAGAAWSVPVVAVALAAPAAAASGWSVTVAFIAAELELRYRDFVVAAVTISNTSTEDIVNEPATFSLTNFDTANEPDFTPSFPEDADVMTDTQNGTTDVDNQLFSAHGSADLAQRRPAGRDVEHGDLRLGELQDRAHRGARGRDVCRTESARFVGHRDCPLSSREIRTAAVR
jgi:hypothetical protein